MGLRINDIAPDFTADSTAGKLSFHEWIGSGYAILFSHPKDFTPVCTTEFGAVAQLSAEFKKRNTKVLGVSVDSAADHEKWKRDIEAFAGVPADFPIIDDSSLTVAKLYDMLPAEFYLPDGRTPAPHRHGTHRLHHRPRQEGATHAHLSDVGGAELRRDPAGPRRHPADRGCPARDPRQLGAGAGRDRRVGAQ